MTIGVDVGALSIKDNRLKVGVYRVIVNLLQQLSKIDKKNDYRLYSFDTIDDSLINSFSETMDSFVLKPKAAWSKIRLPLELLLHPIDLFLGVSQSIPLGFQKNIGFVYDLGFIHHPEVYKNSSKRLLNQTTHVIQRSEYIVTISEASKKDIIEQYKLPPEKVTVAYPGVDERFTNIGDVFKGEKQYFLHVGSLKPGKNIPTLIKSFATFLEKSKKDFVLLVIGGDYWLDEEILTTINEYHVTECVRLLGYVPDEILPQYYRGATAFVSTSLSEGFCLPVLEAMACGCPVIASNIGAFPEVASEESLLFSPTDVASFANAMGNIINNKEFRDIVVAKGLAKSKDYTWESFAQTIYSLIEQTSKNE